MASLDSNRTLCCCVFWITCTLFGDKHYVLEAEYGLSKFMQWCNYLIKRHTLKQLVKNTCSSCPTLLAAFA